MSARDLILDRVRAALANGGAPGAVPRDYRRDTGKADLDLLVERLTDYRAVVHRVGDVAGVVAKILPRDATVVVPPELPPGWLPPTVEALVDDGLAADRIAAADGVVTAAAVAVAETGTIVLDGSPDQGRRISGASPGSGWVAGGLGTYPGEWVDEWSASGVGHHWSLSLDHRAADYQAAASLLGIDFRQV